ncbi:MAG: tRNA (guanine(46)-N(7))-methyltransferase TrmB [Rhodospirillales bacterium]|nr:tRNA (guanine(46)-N(7))-methyltransferase TrmB [Rhodospirillales bacterium]
MIEHVLPALSIPLDGPPGTLRPTSLFPDSIAETWLEIGFGSGEHLTALARTHPDTGFLGCEPFISGVAALLAHLPVEDRSRTRILADDARLLLDALAPASVSRVFLLFPDPWPKRRHAKRRFVQPHTLDQLARVMQPGALLRFASDHPVCQHWVLRQLLDHPKFEWAARRPADFLEPPDDWHGTRYETCGAPGSTSPLFLEFARAFVAASPGGH